MRLREWALSTSDSGARSADNCRVLDGLLRRGRLATTPTISVGECEAQGVHCIRLQFHLPQECQSNGVTSIPVLVPTAIVGTNAYQNTYIFYALVEELIGWLARIGPKHSLVRLYLNNNGQQLPRSYASHWQDLHSGFTLFINGMRSMQSHFPGPGQISGMFGAINVAQARTSSGDISGDYLVTLTLSSRQQMSLFLPRTVAKLPQELMFDWLEAQNEFSTRML